jgi:hypothetical protein
MKNAEWPGEAAQRHLNATSKPPQGLLIANHHGVQMVYGSCTDGVQMVYKATP